MPSLKTILKSIAITYVTMVVINGVAGFVGGSALLNPIGYFRAKKAASAS